MYIYNDAHCFENKIGEEGISKKDVTSVKKKIHNIFKDVFLHTSASTKYYRVIHPKDREELVTTLLPVAKHIRESFDNVIIVSMGGATLGPQTIISLRHARDLKPKVEFLNTTDPIYFEHVIVPLNLKRTAVLVISNSGKTMETISMFGAIVSEMHKAGVKNIGNHCFFITSAGNNPIRKMAQEMHSVIIDHDPGVGGRFTGFTSVGVLSGLIAGLDMYSFIEGLNTVAEDFWRNKEDSVPCQAATTLMLLNKPIWVLLGYLHSFSPFLEWYAQIISESLGKDGKGYTPVRGIGPMDQHSMMQLYLDGPHDKVYTMLYVKDTLHHRSKIYSGAHPDYLKLKTLDEVNRAEFEATSNSVKKCKLPLRTIMMDTYDEFNLGELWMHATLETVVSGHIMGVNPFDQPGVEQIKVEAERLIKASHG